MALRFHPPSLSQGECGIVSSCSRVSWITEGHIASRLCTMPMGGAADGMHLGACRASLAQCALAMLRAHEHEGTARFPDLQASRERHTPETYTA